MSKSCPSRRSAAGRVFLVVCLALAVLAAPQTGFGAKPAKNVILMVADGTGFNTWIATSMYQGKWDAAKGSSQVYDGPGWVRLGCTTYPLNLSVLPTGGQYQSSGVIYDAGKAWDGGPIWTLFGKSVGGYLYLRVTATDSAAAATALATGVKTYNHAINWNNQDQPLRGKTLPEIAKARGKAVGAVTTVQWSHATPACLGGAHNRDRDAYVEIANEMLAARHLDVLMGAGNPDFDDNGRPAAKAAQTAKTSRYVGGPATWTQLKAGQHPGRWRLIETKAAFEALAAEPPASPEKILGTAQVHLTLQQTRGKYRKDDTPFSQPLNPNVPSLATMTKGAMNVLGTNPQGFYLMIEGGAVDWANHTNQAARMIEEQIDFLHAVEAVVRWVDTNSNWEETLLILTADHDCGLPWGPNSAVEPFQLLADRGKDRVPGIRYNSKSHSNSLVPVYAKGAGSEVLTTSVRGTDPKAGEIWRFSGGYVDNTDIFKTIEAVLGK